MTEVYIDIERQFNADVLVIFAKNDKNSLDAKMCFKRECDCGFLAYDCATIRGFVNEWIEHFLTEIPFIKRKQADVDLLPNLLSV